MLLSQVVELLELLDRCALHKYVINTAVIKVCGGTFQCARFFIQV